MSNLRLVEPQGYLEFLNLMASARLVLTDTRDTGRDDNPGRTLSGAAGEYGAASDPRRRDQSLGRERSNAHHR